MLIDTHAHLTSEKYKDKLDTIIDELREVNMEILINPAENLSTSKSGVELANKYDFIYAAAGYHPHNAKDLTESDFREVQAVTEEKKVIAVGEIGLDYHYDNSPRDIQRDVFERHMDLSIEKELPIIVHSREAHKDTYELISERKGRIKGVLHSYSGSWEMAKRYLDLGFYISISGPITFKNARKLPEVAEKLPIDRILVETDSPYLTPVPYRGKMNHPKYVEYVAAEISGIRNISLDEFMENVKENTLKLFKKIL